MGVPKANYCKNLALLFNRDLLTGEKELLYIFQSIKDAKLYRRRRFASKAFRLHVSLQDVAPIELWDVTLRKDPLYIKGVLQER